jgi:hypothetical protein
VARDSGEWPSERFGPAGGLRGAGGSRRPSAAQKFADGDADGSNDLAQRSLQRGPRNAEFQADRRLRIARDQSAQSSKRWARG